VSDAPIGTDATDPPPPAVPGAQRAVARAAAVVGAATLVSRVLGFLRDLVIARAFGAGPSTDAFFVAFRLPNLLRRLVAEGAVSAAFIPVFTEYATKRSRADNLQMLRAVTGLMLLLLGALTLGGILAAPWILRIMAPGFFADPGLRNLTIGLTRLMFPYLFLVGLAAVAMAILNAHRQFLMPALSPVALNVGIIVGALLLSPRLPEPVTGLAVGVLLGGLGQLLVQVPSIWRRDLLAAPRLALRHPAVRRIVKLMAPVIVGQSASHLGTIVNTIIASFLAAGSVSYLYYADRLIEFPLGVFGVAIATAALPTMSEQAARRDPQALRETLSFALRLATFVSAPAAVGLFVLSEPIVRVLYERGRFGPVDTAGTAAAVAMYAIGVIGLSITRVAVQGFYALGDTRTPVKLSIGAMALNCVAAAALVQTRGHVGIALANSIASTANALFLAILLRRKLPGRPVMGARKAWLRTVAVSAGLALFLSAAGRLWPPPDGRLAETAWLATVILGAMSAYLGCHAALGSDEVRLAWSVLTRGGRRSFLRRRRTR
jgi:putative peptidoglycan lipid II flippase